MILWPNGKDTNKMGDNALFTMFIADFYKFTIKNYRFLNSGPLTPDPPGELNIFGHDGDPLGMDGAQVGVLEQPHQVSLACLLKSHHGRTLEPEVGLEILGNLPHEALEGQLTDQQLC